MMRLFLFYTKNRRLYTDIIDTLLRFKSYLLIDTVNLTHGLYNEVSFLIHIGRYDLA